MCKDAGDDPCLEDAFCTGHNAGCPVRYAEDFTPCSKAPGGLFTAVSGFSGATSPASVISSAEAALRNYKKCHLCYKGQCLKTTVIRKSNERRRGDYGAEKEEDWVYCVSSRTFSCWSPNTSRGFFLYWVLCAHSAGLFRSVCLCL